MCLLSRLISSNMAQLPSPSQHFNSLPALYVQVNHAHQDDHPCICVTASSNNIPCQSVFPTDKFYPVVLVKTHRHRSILVVGSENQVQERSQASTTRTCLHCVCFAYTCRWLSSHHPFIINLWTFSKRGSGKGCCQDPKAKVCWRRRWPISCGDWRRRWPIFCGDYRFRKKWHLSYSR